MQIRTDNQEVLRLGQARTSADECFKGALAWLEDGNELAD
jgi:hypothetical protein